MISKEVARALVLQTILDNNEGLISAQKMRNILNFLIDDIYDEMEEYDRRIAFLEDAARVVQP